MGKDRVIKTIANLIAKTVGHKILVKYTNKPHAINHMTSEIDNYRGILAEYVVEYNWNSYDKEEIKKEAEKSLIKELEENHFSDVSVPSGEKDKILNETIEEFFG